MGKGVQAYAPTFPFQRKERWYLILADPLSNSVYGARPASHPSLDSDLCKAGHYLKYMT